MSIRYRAEIDGFRALAICLVIFFHAELSGFSGGYIGVDIFFVISGYLIGGALLKDPPINSEKILKFYANRVARLAPALFFVTFISILFAPLFLSPTTVEGFFESVASVALYVSNIFFWSEADYFDTSGKLKPLLHTWSLAIEEQFYLLFPLLFYLTAGRRIQIAFQIALVLVSLPVIHYTSGSHPSAGFFLLPFRAWELVCGSLIAFLRTPVERSFQNDLLSLLGGVGILLSVATFSKDMPHPSIFTLLPVVSTCLLLRYGSEGTYIARFFSLRPLTVIGLLSYSLYLWHQPVFAFARTLVLYELSLFQKLVLVVISLMLSYCTLHYVESPARSYLKKFPRKAFKFWWASSLSLVLLAVVGVVLGGNLNNQVNPFNSPDFRFRDKNNLADRLETWRYLEENNNKGVQSISSQELMMPSVVTILGDSHSKDLFNTLHASGYSDVGFSFSRHEFELRNLEASFLKLRASEAYLQSERIIISFRYKSWMYEQLITLIEQTYMDGKSVYISRPIIELAPVRGDAWSFSDGQEYLLKSQKVSKVEKARLINLEYERQIQNPETYATNKSELQSFDRLLVDPRVEGMIAPLDRLEYICPGSGACAVVDDALTSFFSDSHHQSLSGTHYYGALLAEINWLGMN